MKNNHEYSVGLEWKGFQITDKRNKLRYERLYQLNYANKPSIMGSADAVFFGDDNLYNPEEMLLSALVSCYMMSFFYLCGKQNIYVENYSDSPIGIVKINADGSGQFEKVTLFPTIHIKQQQKEIQTLELLFREAHKYCFIARSCNFLIEHKPKIIYI